MGFLQHSAYQILPKSWSTTYWYIHHIWLTEIYTLCWHWHKPKFCFRHSWSSVRGLDNRHFHVCVDCFVLSSPFHYLLWLNRLILILQVLYREQIQLALSKQFFLSDQLEVLFALLYCPDQGSPSHSGYRILSWYTWQLPLFIRITALNQHLIISIYYR